MHLPNTLGPSWCCVESRRVGAGQDSILHSLTVQHTHVRQLSTAFERMNQTYSTAIGTHGSARHFDLTFVDTQAMVAVDVCIDSGQGCDAEWRDNMQQYRWRSLAKPDAHTEMLSLTRNGISSSSAARNAYSLLDWGPRFLSKNAQPFLSH